MKYLKTFENFDKLNEGFSAPELTGKVTTLKKAGDMKSQKKSSLLGQLSLKHGSDNILGKEVVNTMFSYDPQDGRYKKEFNIKHEDYNGKVLVILDWDFGTKELSYGAGRNIQWVSFKPSRPQLLATNTDKDKTPPTKTTTFDLDAENYFDYDSAELKTEGVEFLKSLADKIKGKTLKVDGYASIEGSLEHNKELSQNRANSVAALLKDLGANVVSSVGHGGVETFGAGEENYPKNRKVVITLK